MYKIVKKINYSRVNSKLHKISKIVNNINITYINIINNIIKNKKIINFEIYNLSWLIFYHLCMCNHSSFTCIVTSRQG